MKTKFK